MGKVGCDGRERKPIKGDLGKIKIKDEWRGRGGGE